MSRLELIILIGILAVSAFIAGRFSLAGNKNLKIEAAYLIATRTPTPVCNGLCIPNGESCYRLGSGGCPKYKICCKIINSPTPTRRPTRTPTPACNGLCIPNGKNLLMRFIVAFLYS